MLLARLPRLKQLDDVTVDDDDGPSNEPDDEGESDDDNGANTAPRKLSGMWLLDTPPVDPLHISPSILDTAGISPRGGGGRLPSVL